MKTRNKIIFYTLAGLFLMAIFILVYFSTKNVKVINVESKINSQVKSENSENLVGQNNISSELEDNTNENAGVVDNKVVKEDVAEPDDKKNVPEDKVEETVKNETAKKNTESQIGLASWGFSAGRSQAVDTIIIHSVYNSTGGDRYDLGKILGIFKDYGVAPHYIIERSGKVRQLVLEKNTAYHAGESEMPDGRTGVNNFSIGIEIINAEDDKPESAQYKSLETLVKGIESRYKIKYILGHSDIAPGRKTDPWNFDWTKSVEKKS